MKIQTISLIYSDKPNLDMAIEVVKYDQTNAFAETIIDLLDKQVLLKNEIIMLNDIKVLLKDEVMKLKSENEELKKLLKNQ